MTQTKEQAQIQLQNALTTTFLANLAFLSEYDKELYKRVDELSRMIENGTYKEKYALEFIMENGDFDIYDIVNDKYMYDRNPKKRNDELVKKIKFDQKESIFTLNSYYTMKTPVQIDYEKRFEFEKLSELSALTIRNIQEYTNYTKDYIENNKKKFKKFDKFIFLGTLLGRHIPKIAEKIDASSYLVLERNLEIFRLSLFTVDYTILAKKGVIFSIMDSAEIEEKKIHKFIDFYKVENYFIKVSTTNINIERYIDVLLNSLQIYSPFAYDYNRRVYTYLNRFTQIAKEDYKFLDFKNIQENTNVFEDIPILYIAAGPSLDENLEWIKKNQDKFFIVCIGRALKKLVSNQIRVDIVTTLDEQEILADIQFDDETMKLVGKNTLLFTSTLTNKNVLNKFSKENIFIFNTVSSINKKSVVFSGFSIGEVTYDILLRFNPKEIYMIGLDLAVDQKTGSTHSSEDRVKVLNIDLTKKDDRSSFSVKNSLIKVKGNLKKEVFTIPIFYANIKSMESKARYKNRFTKVYNLSLNGAKFKRVNPKRVNTVDTTRYTNIENFNIKSFLNSHLLEIVDDEVKDNINQEIMYIEKDLEKILIKIEKNKRRFSYNNFLKEIDVIIFELIKNKLYNLRTILDIYNQITILYLNYYFNDKNLKTERDKVQDVKKIYISQIRNIINDYKYCLEKLIK